MCGLVPFPERKPIEIEDCNSIICFLLNNVFLLSLDNDQLYLIHMYSFHSNGCFRTKKILYVVVVL